MVSRPWPESFVTDAAAPWLWLVAGPNGAGKSTYAWATVYALSHPPPERVSFLGGRETVDRMRALLDRRESFAFETALSGSSRLRLARQAKSEGWNLGLVYVGLRSSDLAVSRVRNRKCKRGRGVPAADVRRRYQGSLRNLLVVYQMADEVLVFDNSSAREPMRRLLEARAGRMLFKASRLPSWPRGALGAELGRGRRRARK